MKNSGMPGDRVGDLVVIVEVYTAEITDEKHIDSLNSIKPNRKTYE